ncbi:hypothetical protein ACM66B_000360 [Microbotryomycetes sp. NB124-2]
MGYREQKEREDRLKRQADRVGSSVTALAAREHAPVVTGSYDSGDPTTTNVHVAPLPPNVTEQSLGLFFAEYGPVGSVKIMWPRADNIPFNARGTKSHLGGFVAFLRRPDAERAMNELEGAEWGGNVLRLGWGKAVPLPARPIYEIEGASSRSARDYERRRRSPSDDRGRSRSPDRSRRRRSYSHDSRSRSRSRSRSPPRRAWPKLENGVDERFLSSIASRVREHGRGFEEMLREKESRNPKFEFLRNSKLPSYHYFKMLLDSRYEPPLPVEFADEGLAELYSSDSAEDSERERTSKGRLGKLAKRRFEALLRCLTSTRGKIAKGMAFALEHADCAQYIADLLVCSLTIDETPVPRKIARLHLVSDILHNSSSSLPNAWVYRSIFESRLPDVFDHLGDVYNSFPGRMKAEQFKAQVSKIVDVWEHDWMIFEPSTIEDWRRRLSGVDDVDAEAQQVAAAEALLEEQELVEMPAETRQAAATSTTPARSGFKTTFQPSALDSSLAQDIDVDGVDVDGDAVVVDEEVDGAPLDVDGEDLDGAAIDVDGDAVAFQDDDVDGEPAEPVPESIVLDEGPELDGEAMEIEDSGDEDMFDKK